MKLMFAITLEGFWRLEGIQPSGATCIKEVKRAEGVLVALEDVVRWGGNWSTVEWYADISASKSFTNNRLLSVWMNTIQCLYAIPMHWRIDPQGAWQNWSSPQELPYHAEPNINKSA